MTALLLKSIKQVKRLMIAIVGFTVLFIGIVMIVLPGPAFIQHFENTLWSKCLDLL